MKTIREKSSRSSAVALFLTTLSTMARYMKFYLIVLGLAFSVASTARANYCFTSIDVPGTLDIEAYGINNSGDIVGYYVDATGGDHGFLYAGGSFISIDVPGTPYSWTFARGINDSGSIVGSYGDGSTHLGFLYTGGGFTSINGGCSGSADAYGINNSGDIVGMCINKGALQGMSFLYTGGVHTSIARVPGALDTDAYGINDSGDIVGSYTSGVPSIWYGFLYTKGSFSSIHVPSANTWAYGINNSGHIVGSYANGANWHGFLYAGGSFISIDVPGALDTYPYGINDSGDIVGYYVDATGAHRGFIATPVTVSPLSQSFSSSGGIGSTNVTALSGCGWTAISNNPDWITITSGNSGSGNGTVTYLVAANTSTNQRTGTMTIAGQTFAVTQAGLSFTLIVLKSGTGSGTVTSSPAGINCGTTCSETYPKTQKVKLTAKADTNSTFNGWSSGGCSGTGTCQVTVDSTIAIRASFALKIPHISVSPGSLDFGSVKAGKSIKKALVITNNGTGDLSVTLDGLAGTDFSTIGKTSITVKPKKSYNLSVTFKPTSTGTETATLKISSNDPDASILEIPISGTGQ